MFVFSLVIGELLGSQGTVGVFKEEEEEGFICCNSFFPITGVHWHEVRHNCEDGKDPLQKVWRRSSVCNPRIPGKVSDLPVHIRSVVPMVQSHSISVTDE